MTDERRRYFRINETVGISYQCIDGSESHGKKEEGLNDDTSRIFEQDDQIEKLINELKGGNPLIAQLAVLLNRKMDRIADQQVLRNDLVNRIAHRVREVNISACGMAFMNDEPISEGERLRLELKLFPAETKVQTLARIISCDWDEATKQYYWRMDFYSMSASSQETLIQHIVRSQSAQLKGNRKK